MSKELWKYFDRLRKKGGRIDLETIAKLVSEKKIDVTKDEIINILKNNRFFGEYYTPNDIARLMAELGRRYNPDNIIDICCGIGNILSYCDYGKEIEGIDRDIHAVKIANVINPHAKIVLGNTLEKKFDKKYDLVFGDFPFGMRIKKKKRFFFGEELFVNKALSILRPDAVFIGIVPNSFLFNNNFSYLRRKILDKYNLKLIVYLPAGIIPNTSVRSAIIYIQNKASREKVYLEDYKENSDEIVSNFVRKTGQLYVSKNDLDLRWDRDYHDPEYKKIEAKLKGKDIKTLSELTDVFVGYSPGKYERLDRGQYLLIGGRNIRDDDLERTKQDKYINSVEKSSFKRAILKPGDIIVSLLFKQRKMYVYKNNDPRAVLNNSCALIRSNQSEYIHTYLNSEEGQKIFIKQAKRVTKGSVIPRLSIGDLRNIKIPIIPIGDLRKVSNQVIKKSSTEELEILKEEIVYLKQLLAKQKRINKEQKKFFEDREEKIINQISTNELFSRIKGGESKKLEFKSTLRWNLHTNKKDNSVENAALKTIAAFCNAEGGDLLIGINDKGEILGIELDNFKNDDKYLLHLGNIINQRILQTVQEFVDTKIVEVQGKKICKVSCKKSSYPIWFKAEKKSDEQFFVRTGPSSKPLSPMKAFDYINSHFKK